MEIYLGRASRQRLVGLDLVSRDAQFFHSCSSQGQKQEDVKDKSAFSVYPEKIFGVKSFLLKHILGIILVIRKGDICHSI